MTDARIRGLALAGLILFAVVHLGLSFDPDQQGRPDHDWSRVEEARLMRWLAHAAPESPEALKLRTKLDRLEAWRRGEPEQGFPDRFAQMLQERKIPADREAPEYRPGYQVRELQKARAARKSTAVALPWQSRGPGNVAGRARGILIDPDDPSASTWYIASVGGGVWKTGDAGATWTALTDGLPLLQISSLAMSPANTNVIYAGTGESFFNIDVMNGNGIYKSGDKGQSWTPLASTVGDPRFNNISRIIVDPADEDVVVVSATTGRYKLDVNATSSIFRSTDGGATWTEVYVESDIGSFERPKKVLQVIADPTDFQTQYATIDEKGILKSTDGGQSWLLSSSGITDFTGRFELAIHPVETNRLYASAEGAAHSELWISDDAGATWSETFENGTERNWLGAQGWYDNTIVCHPTDPDIVYVGGIRLWQITLSGTSRVTSSLSTGPVHVDHHNLVVFTPQGEGWRLLNTNDGGVGVSASGASSWSAPIGGMVTTQFYGIDKRPGRSAYVGGMQDNSTWRSPIDPDPGSEWTFQIGGDGYETSWHFDDPQKIIGGFQFNGIRRSLDGGLTWQAATAGLSDTGGSRAPFVTKIAKTNDDPELLFAVGVSGVWRSTDFGGSWNSIGIESSVWGPLSSFHDIRVSRADPNVVVAGSRMDASGSLVLSTDRGLTFSPMAQFTDLVMGRISGLATHPTENQTFYALFSFAQRPKVLRTTDQGNTWEDISGYGTGTASTNGFPDVAVYDLLVWPNDTDRIWVGTEIGLVESVDGGLTWQIADNGLPSVGIWQLRQVEDEIIVATHGRGIWTVTLPELTAGRTFAPLLEQASQSLESGIFTQILLRSAYDSTQVRVDGAIVETLSANLAGEEVVRQVPVLAAGTVQVRVHSFSDGVEYASIAKSVDVVALNEPVFTYVNDFEAPTDDFTGQGFAVRSFLGFAGDAIHSPHPYPDGESSIFMLRTPIKVAVQDARLEFDEVVVVEPGEPGSVFGDFTFWDYVVVEGSSDGLVWEPLLPGYDSREDSAWLNAYNSGGTNVSSSLYRHRVIDLLQTFAPNELILVRFRLFADESVNSWGWVIDNLEIQLDSTEAGVPGAPSLALDQNVPNPFNPSTAIRFILPARGAVSLKIYDARGRLVRTLLEEVRDAGGHEVRWDGRDHGGKPAASGVYLYRLVASEETRLRKMILLK